MKHFFVLIFTCILLAACQHEKVEYEPLPMDLTPYQSTTGVQYDDLMTAQHTVRAGMFLPLTGEQAKLGEHLRNAALLAQFDSNNDHLILQFYDTKGTAEGAREAFWQARNENIQVILGPVFSEEVTAIRSMAQRYDIPVIAFSSDPDILDEGVYTMALSLSEQIERIVRFACEQGRTRLAILAPDSKAGDITYMAAKQTADACGMELTAKSFYVPTYINFEPYVLKVLPPTLTTANPLKKEKSKNKEKNAEESEEDEPKIADLLDFDTLLIADEGNRLKSIAALFALYDVTPDEVMFIGMSQWQDPSLTKEGALIGSYFPSLTRPDYEAFVEKYQTAYGSKPVRLASLSYDAVKLIAFLGQNGQISEEVLTQPNGFRGTDGLFRFRRDGTSERLLGVSQIRPKNRFRIIEPPAATFAEEETRKIVPRTYFFWE